MTTQATQLLAASIMAAMKAREDSYDKVTCDKDKAEAGVVNAGYQRGEHNNQIFLDFSLYYSMTLRQAVASVTLPELREPVFLLLHYSPNDAQDWAQQVLNPSIPANVGEANDTSFCLPEPKEPLNAADHP